MLVEHCSPSGNTPLITVYPDMHFVFAPAAMANCILDTHALLDLRPGFRRLTRVDRSREQQFAASRQATTRTVAPASSSSAAIPGGSVCFPSILEVEADDEASDHAMEEVLSFGPGQSASVVAVSRLLPPDGFLTVAAGAIQLAGPCILQVPSVAVIPASQYHRHYLLVDARQVLDCGLGALWLQDAPPVVNPVIRITLLRGAQPNLRQIGAMFLDSTPVVGYSELAARVTLLTVLPSAFEHDRRPTPLLNGRALRTRPGFMQRDLRASNSLRRRRSPARSTSTTTTCAADLLPCTTTTSTPAGDPRDTGVDARRGAMSFRINDCWVRCYVAGSDLHVESVTLQRASSLSDLLTQLCCQLWSAGHLLPDSIFHACDRAFNDHDAGFSIYISAQNRGGACVSWIDALPFGLAPFPVALPFCLTEDTLCQSGTGTIPRMAHVAINGIPWSGEATVLRHADVVTVRPSHSALFSFPLSALEERIAQITALLLPRRGPSGGIRVLDDGTTGTQPFLYAPEAFTQENIRNCWLDVQLGWEMKMSSGEWSERCVLVSATMQPLIVALGTRVAPCAEHVNLWFRTHMQRAYGPKFWCESGLVFGGLTVFFDAALFESDRQAWIFTVGECVDVLLADRTGDGLSLWPAPEGWRLNPVFTAGPIGQAAMQLRSAERNPVFQQSLPASALREDNVPCDRPLSDDEGLPVSFDAFDTLSVSSDDDCQEVLAPIPPVISVENPSEEEDESLQLLQRVAVVAEQGRAPTPAHTEVILRPVEETTPRTALQVFGRPIPTPCLNVARKRDAVVLEPQGGARDVQAVEQSHCAALAPETQYVPADKTSPCQRRTISLVDCLSDTADVSRPLQVPCDIDEFLQSVEPLRLTALCQDWMRIPALHPAARGWVSYMPNWDRRSPLASVTLYTDGSFQPGSGRSSWAVLLCWLCRGGAAPLPAPPLPRKGCFRRACRRDCGAFRCSCHDGSS